MSLISEVNVKEEGFFKKLNQNDWLVLIAVSVVVVGFATFYTIKKRRNAKL
jgi:LPXTG-motif cell wall-anchored protein